MSIRVRFAPSPTGYLHVGNVRTALFNWFFARHHQGQFVIRIEDTDAERSEVRFENQLLADLEWLGIDWDEGPDIGGEFGPYRQTDRFPLYRQEVRTLLEKGLAYYCFCTSQQLEEDRLAQQSRGESIQYVGRCRDLSPEEASQRVEAGTPATVRFRVREGEVHVDDVVFGGITVKTDTIGDFILLRSDGSPQYNLACVVDDALMGITHVIRGEGHISNTHRQALLYESLGFPIPSFAHLSTILGPDGAKLSKRHGATSLAEFRSQGFLPEAVVNYLSLLGWPPPEGGEEILPVKEIVRLFELQRVNVSPATFDLEKLKWVNRGHLKRQPPETLEKLARPFLEEAGLIDEQASPAVIAWLGELLDALVNYLDTLADLKSATAFLHEFDPAADLSDGQAQEVLGQDGATDVILAFREELNRRPDRPVDFDLYKECVLAVKDGTGQKGKNLFRPIRLAVTARSSGPELEKIIPILERGSTLALPKRIPGVRERVNRVADTLVAGASA